MYEFEKIRIETEEVVAFGGGFECSCGSSELTW